jgi:hypothetical protein
MDPFFWIINHIDPLLIWPYRWLDNPTLSWPLGTFCLALWAGIIGELTLALAYRLNHRQVSLNDAQTQYYHHQSLAAKKAGDETAYKGINDLANEAFGKAFFLLAAMGMASLWPAFFAAAWLDLRFGELSFAMPHWAGGLQLTVIAPFIVFYIIARVLISKTKKLILPSVKAVVTGRQDAAAQLDLRQQQK